MKVCSVSGEIPNRQATLFPLSLAEKIASESPVAESGENSEQSVGKSDSCVKCITGFAPFSGAKEARRYFPTEAAETISCEEGISVLMESESELKAIIPRDVATQTVLSDGLKVIPFIVKRAGLTVVSRFSPVVKMPVSVNRKDVPSARNPKRNPPSGKYSQSKMQPRFDSIRFSTGSRLDETIGLELS